jgi:glycerophosphoryl diester phosphodiesterase
LNRVTAVLGRGRSPGYWIELDVRWELGRLVARHDERLWRLPIGHQRWRLKPAALRPPLLDEIIAATEGGPHLLLDCKGSDHRLPDTLVETLSRSGLNARAAVCGQNWPLLDRIGQLDPRMSLVYSLGCEAHVAALRRRVSAVPPISAVSVEQKLLTPALMRQFSSQAVSVFAWTVNAEARARELLELGVAGIISDRLDLLSKLLGEQSGVI